MFRRTMNERRIFIFHNNACKNNRQLPPTIALQTIFSPIMLSFKIFGMLSLACGVRGFLSTPTHVIVPQQGSSLNSSRRSFLDHGSSATLAVVGTLLVRPGQAVASGGATAGGAYLLSAKQRYNDRVKAGVKGFVALQGPLESGDLAVLRTFFSSVEVGQWQDFSSAGYLLSNAFRRNSSAAPDSLPSVKKWKAYAAQVEGMTKALKKKDSKGAAAAYQSSMGALDEYLGQVELPSAVEIASS